MPTVKKKPKVIAKKTSTKSIKEKDEVVESTQINKFPILQLDLNSLDIVKYPQGTMISLKANNCELALTIEPGTNNIALSYTEFNKKNIIVTELKNIKVDIQKLSDILLKARIV